LFLTPSKTDGRVPSQQGAPDNLQPNLLRSFPADICPEIIGQFGCGHRAKFCPSGGGGRENIYFEEQIHWVPLQVVLETRMRFVPLESSAMF